ncbi:MAG TPA: hypothetical protein VK436_10295 [Methanocella sp.]|nr:hypothetical protein [Methanocella sp.]
MNQPSEKCSQVVEALSGLEVPTEVMVEEIMDRRGRPAARSALLIKALLMDFGVTSDLDVIQAVYRMNMQCGQYRLGHMHQDQ